MWKVLLKWVLLAMENDQRYHNIGKQGILIFLLVSFIHIHHCELVELENAMFFVSLQELCRILMAFCSQQDWGWLSSAEEPAGTQAQCSASKDCFMPCSDPSQRPWMGRTDPDWAQDMLCTPYFTTLPICSLLTQHCANASSSFSLTFSTPSVNLSWQRACGVRGNGAGSTQDKRQV